MFNKYSILKKGKMEKLYKVGILFTVMPDFKLKKGF